MYKKFRLIVEIILLLILFRMFINEYIFINANIPSGSMTPTLNTGDKVIVNKIIYKISKPKYGDVAVFKHPDHESILFVKRVIGLPGDKIVIKQGKVYLNDSDIPIEEPYVMYADTGDYGPYIVPEGHYFMLGDNRNESQDSRFWDNTYVANRLLIGEMILKYSPEFKFIN